MSLLPMHKKQDYLFFLSLMYCSFYLRFVCPVEYILFMFTPHNTDLNVFFLNFYIAQHRQTKNQCQPKKIENEMSNERVVFVEWKTYKSGQRLLYFDAMQKL